MTEQQDDPVARWQSVLSGLHAQLETEQARAARSKATKKELALAALTAGGEAAQGLAQANKDLFKANLRLEDLADAIGQAQAQLAEAEAERQAEHERRVRVSDLAERRIAVAAKIDDAADALGALLVEHDQISREMLLEHDPTDTAFARRIDGIGRLRAVMVDKTPALFAGTEGAPTRDPRRHRSLADLEREALAPFVLSEAGKTRSAA
jgi:hypothetical protein